MEFLRRVKTRLFGWWWNVKSDDVLRSKPRSHLSPFELQITFCCLKCKELALWTRIEHSIIALISLQLIYGYLRLTNRSSLNVIGWMVMFVYLWSSWVNKVWPTIRLEKPPEDENITAKYEAAGLLIKSEIKNVYNRFRSRLLQVLEVRQSFPAFFALVSSTFFIFLALIGSYVSLLSLGYLAVSSILILPALASKYPVLWHYLGLLVINSQSSMVDVVDYSYASISAVQFSEKKESLDLFDPENMLEIESYKEEDEQTQEYNDEDSLCCGIDVMPDHNDVFESTVDALQSDHVLNIDAEELPINDVLSSVDVDELHEFLPNDELKYSFEEDDEFEVISVEDTTY